MYLYRCFGKTLSRDVSKTAALGRQHYEPHRPTPTDQLKDAVEALSRNNFERGVALLKEQGRIHEYADPNHRLAALSTDSAKGPARSIVVSPNPDERGELTALIRRELGRERAQLTGSRGKAGRPASSEELRAGRYHPLQERQRRAWNCRRFTRDRARSGPQGQPHHRRTGAGEQVSYRLHQAKAVSQQSTLYREEQREFAVEDRIRFTAPVPEHGIPARAFGTVSGRSGDGTFDIALDIGKQVQLTADQARHIDYGYAVSSPARADRVLSTCRTQDSSTATAGFTRHSPEPARTPCCTRTMSRGYPRGGCPGRGSARTQVPSRLRPSSRHRGTGDCFRNGPVAAPVTTLTCGKEIDLKPEQLLQFRTARYDHHAPERQTGITGSSWSNTLLG